MLDRCRVHSLDRGSTTNNGYVTAASTSVTNPYGFLFTAVPLHRGRAAAGTVYLGRPWHPSQDPNAIAQVVIRESVLDAHIKAAPWTDFGTWSWRDARYARVPQPWAGRHGDGRPPAAHPRSRPAATHAAARTCAGTDGWDPAR